MLGRECGVRSVGERKYRSPLYYPDTLVNPDTCLGIILKIIVTLNKSFSLSLLIQGSLWVHFQGSSNVYQRFIEGSSKVHIESLSKVH